MEVQQGLGVGVSQRERVLVEAIKTRCPRQLVRRAGKATLPACRGPIDCPSAGLAEGRYYICKLQIQSQNVWQWNLSNPALPKNFGLLVAVIETSSTQLV